MHALRDLALMTLIFLAFVVGATGSLWAGLSLAGVLGSGSEAADAEADGEPDDVADATAELEEIPDPPLVGPEAMSKEAGAGQRGSSPSASTPYDQALAAYGRGETELSIELFRRAAEQEPDNPDVYRGLSTVLLQAGRNREAAAALRQLLRVSDEPTEQRGLKVVIAALEEGKSVEQAAGDTAGDKGSGAQASGLLAALQSLPPAPNDDVVPMGQGLSRTAVRAVFERHRRQLVPCFKRAKKQGRVEAGELELVLDMRIAASGKIKKLKVVAPEEAAGGAIQQCLRTAIKRWRFPKAPLPTDVDRYSVELTL